MSRIISPARSDDVRSFDVLDSTNAEALRLARAGERANVWIVADRQTAGRGRRGRQWASPPGNFYASVLLDGPCAPQDCAQLSFVAALALSDALLERAPALGRSLALKWPNDLLAGEAKVAGILTEAEARDDASFAVAVGFGVNCVSHPRDTPYPATDLAAAGFALAPRDILAALRAAMAVRIDAWDRGAGFPAIRRDWLLRAARIHEPIRLRTPHEVSGTFEGLDERGRLLLRDASGILQAFAAGDVHAPHAGGNVVP